MSNVRIINSLADLRPSYDALLCDIWGVVHNGIDPFPKAIEALQAFRKSGGKVALITNAPRPSQTLHPQFDAIGVPHDIYDHIVSSGDVTRHELVRFKGHKVFHLGPERDQPLLDGMDLETSKLADADFILCSGLFDDETETPDDYADLIQAAKARDLEMICANPDIVVQRGDQLIYCGGAIAQAYEVAGGKTTYAGKPHAPIYDHCLDLLIEGGAKVMRTTTLVIGDGPKTDIRGGVLQGFDSLFIGGGIHAKDCFHDDGSLDEKGMNDVFGEEGSFPTYASPWLLP